MGPSVVVGSLCVWSGSLAGSSLVGCQILPRTDAAGRCSPGPDHKVACGNLGGPRASADALVGS